MNISSLIFMYPIPSFQKSSKLNQPLIIRHIKSLSDSSFLIGKISPRFKLFFFPPSLDAFQSFHVVLKAFFKDWKSGMTGSISVEHDRKAGVLKDHCVFPPEITLPRRGAPVFVAAGTLQFKGKGKSQQGQCNFALC